MSSLTIQISEELRKQLEDLSRRDGRAVTEIVADSLERYLAVKRFLELRSAIQTEADAAGFKTDDDVFRAVS